MAVGQHVHLREFQRRAQSDGALDIVVIGHTANQHDVADHSAIVAGCEHHAIGVGEVVAESRLGQVLVDERGDILRGHRRRTRQRKRACGDVGEFGKIGDDGRG